MNEQINRRRRALCLSVPAGLAGVAVTGTGAVLPRVARAAEAYPAKPITLIMPYPAGGATDVQFRALVIPAAKALGQSIVVVNQPGVGGTLAPAAMARTAAPDGYTIAVANAALFRLPHIQKVSFNPLTDFTYIMGLNRYVFGLCVANNAPWKTPQELLAFAKANPGKVNIGATGTGTSGHILVKRLAKAAGVELNYVPFKGGAEVLVALMGGHIQAMFDGGWAASAEAGRIRPLAVAEEKRLERWAKVPTLREMGYDIVAISEVGIAGPKGMDPKVVKVLHDAFKAAIPDAGYQRALQMESMPNAYMSTADYQRYAFSQYDSDKYFVKQLGIRLD